MKNDVDNMKSEKYLLIKSHASFKEWDKKFYNVDQRFFLFFSYRVIKVLA